MPYGSFARWCRRGRTKAAVLPVPVSAAPITSFPLRIGGMQAACTGVGVRRPRDVQAVCNHGARPREANVEGFGGSGIAEIEVSARPGNGVHLLGICFPTVVVAAINKRRCSVGGGVDL